MIESDFEKHGIHNFTAEGVRKTGARLEDVQLELMVSLQRFREYIRRRVYIVNNGMTTGGHLSPWHPLGKAVDPYLDPRDGEVKTHEIFKGAIHSGFKGIGIYWNQNVYSFHFDLRPNYAFWAGVKDDKNGINNWKWFPLITDLTKIRL